MIIELKSNEDVEGFKKVGAATSKIIRILKHHISAGWTGIDLDNIAIEECKKINSIPVFLDYRGFPASVCVSVNNVLVHGIPNNVPFRDGDIVSVDFGLMINGYIGDMAITKIVGEHCGSRLISECKFALWSAIKQMKPGNRLSHISRAVEKVAKDNNFQIPKEYGGHGIDRYILHSSPFVPNYISQNEEDKDIFLYPGMVIAVEPMFIESSSDNLVIASDKWSVIAEGNSSHFEHTVLITNGDPVILTQE